MMKTAPELVGSKKGKKWNMGIVVAHFNPQITGKMLESAQKYSTQQNMEVTIVVQVPGSLEIPLATKRLLKKSEVDGVVCLGAILKGSTQHDEIIGHAIAKALIDLSLNFDKPIGVGIIGPGATELLAIERAEEYARRAVLAVRQMLDAFE
jgi:6,7-dimethyl-8-ribityllumazine synthase